MKKIFKDHGVFIKGVKAANCLNIADDMQKKRIV